MKYLYPIRKSENEYHFGRTDVDEASIENVCYEKCLHTNPVEASDCFREKLLKNKAITFDIEPRKCCFPKCSNSTTKMVNYGYNFQFAVCKEHTSKASIRSICGFGLPLILREA